jgi:adenine C2-methylase RlmN of 23S rRNA A2503 and tRNA A37
METNTDRPQPTQLSASKKLQLLRDAAWVTNQAAGHAYFMAADLYDDSESMAKVYKALSDARHAALRAWNILSDEAVKASEEEKDSVDSSAF